MALTANDLRPHFDQAIDLVKPEASHLTLLPCPFCGNPEIYYVRYIRDEFPTENRWMVLCTHCMATLDPGYAQQMYTVRELWNRRTPALSE